VRRIARTAGLLVALLAAAPVAALAAPDLEATVGGTLAISGTPDGGGWSVSLSPMWEVEDRWLFGVMLFADDMGTEFGRLTDPNDGSDPEWELLSEGGPWGLNLSSDITVLKKFRDAECGLWRQYYDGEFGN